MRAAVAVEHPEEVVAADEPRAGGDRVLHVPPPPAHRRHAVPRRRAPRVLLLLVTLQPPPLGGLLLRHHPEPPYLHPPPPRRAAAACAADKFSGNRVFATCVDLPRLGASLHWTYDTAASSLSVAFLAAPPSGGWVAWGLNPSADGMIGTQALIAVPKGGGAYEVQTYAISGLRVLVGFPRAALLPNVRPRPRRPPPDFRDPQAPERDRGGEPGLAGRCR